MYFQWCDSKSMKPGLRLLTATFFANSFTPAELAPSAVKAAVAAL
jgi:hypothetical protein